MHQFTAADLKCHDGTPYPEQFQDRLPELLSMLDKIYEMVPFEIVSGYRTSAYNKRLQAKSAAHQVASGSQHVQGRACDIRPLKGTLLEFYHAVLAAHDFGDLPELGGLGLYPRSNWIHCDTFHAPDGHLRSWNGS